MNIEITVKRMIANLPDGTTKAAYQSEVATATDARLHAIKRELTGKMVRADHQHKAQGVPYTK